MENNVSSYDKKHHTFCKHEENALQISLLLFPILQ